MPPSVFHRIEAISDCRGASALLAFPDFNGGKVVVKIPSGIVAESKIAKPDREPSYKVVLRNFVKSKTFKNKIRNHGGDNLLIHSSDLSGFAIPRQDSGFSTSFPLLDSEKGQKRPEASGLNKKPRSLDRTRLSGFLGSLDDLFWVWAFSGLVKKMPTDTALVFH